MEPVEAFLRWLTDTERSPNTVRAYAGDLRQFWEFVGLRGYGWADLGVEELGDFASWLRSPAENVIVLPGGASARGVSTVNRKLAAVAAFYDFHHRQSGVLVAERLHPPWHRSGRGSFKPMLQGFAPLRARGRVGRCRSGGGYRRFWRCLRSRRSCAHSGGCVTGSCSLVVPDGDAGRAGARAAARGCRDVGEPDRDRVAARTTRTVLAGRAGRGASRSAPS